MKHKYALIVGEFTGDGGEKHQVLRLSDGNTVSFFRTFEDALRAAPTDKEFGILKVLGIGAMVSEFTMLPVDD